MIELRAVLGMRVLLGSLALLGACDAGAKLEPRPEPEKKAPVIVVTKSEITYQGRVIDTVESVERYPAPDAGAGAPSCVRVLEQLSRAVFAYDPSYVALAATYTPKVLASCQEDGWPEELKRCVVDASPNALAHEHACEEHFTPELRGKVAKRLGLSAGTLSTTR